MQKKNLSDDKKCHMTFPSCISQPKPRHLSIAARRLELISSNVMVRQRPRNVLCRKSVLKKSNRADPDFLFPKPLRFPDTCIPKHCNFDKQRLRCEVLSNRLFREKDCFSSAYSPLCVNLSITHRVRIHTCLIMPPITRHHRAMLRISINDVF